MGDSTIPDVYISASSEYSSSFLASYGRLHFQKGWIAAVTDANQWLQVDLRSRFANVTRVGTQGRSDDDQRVTKYYLQYGDSISNFQYYKELGQNTSKVNLSLKLNKAFRFKLHFHSIIN